MRDVRLALEIDRIVDPLPIYGEIDADTLGKVGARTAWKYVLSERKKFAERVEWTIARFRAEAASKTQSCTASDKPTKPVKIQLNDAQTGTTAP
jgi:hypothetical protein